MIFASPITKTLAAFVLLAVLFGSPALAEKRVALVVGNSSYQNVTRLDNPRNDASLERDEVRLNRFAIPKSG
jgi:hypothetical protein